MDSVNSTEAVEYRPVPGCPEYRVGIDGSLWSLWAPGSLPGTKSGWHLGTEWRKMAGAPDKDGYRKAILISGGRRRDVRISTLILESFVGPCPPGMEACHTNDPDPSNDRVDNLRWDTHKNNIADKRKHGTVQEGERNPRAILTKDIAREIRRRFEQGQSNKEIAEHFDIRQSIVWQIVHNWTWKCALPTQDETAT